MAVPGSLYIIGKFFGLDQKLGLDISQGVDMAVKFSWGILMLGSVVASTLARRLEAKLSSFKSKKETK